MAILVESCVASARGQQFYSTLWIFRETNPLLAQGLKPQNLLIHILLPRHYLPYRDFHIYVASTLEDLAEVTKSLLQSPPPT